MKLLKAIEVDYSSIVCSIIHIPPHIGSAATDNKEFVYKEKECDIAV